MNHFAESTILWHRSLEWILTLSSWYLAILLSSLGQEYSWKGPVSSKPGVDQAGRTVTQYHTRQCGVLSSYLILILPVQPKLRNTYSLCVVCTVRSVQLYSVLYAVQLYCVHYTIQYAIWTAVQCTLYSVRMLCVQCTVCFVQLYIPYTVLKEGGKCLLKPQIYNKLLFFMYSLSL